MADAISGPVRYSIAYTDPQQYGDEQEPTPSSTTASRRRQRSAAPTLCPRPTVQRLRVTLSAALLLMAANLRTIAEFMRDAATRKDGIHGVPHTPRIRKRGRKQDQRDLVRSLHGDTAEDTTGADDPG